jgi:predicted short-subunit dehydrogenase-like oxidoreductase (DUF2520 family)
MGIPSQDSRWLDSFSVVGTGALARSLTRALVQQGMTCRAMMGRNAEVLEHCAQLFGIGSVAILGSQPVPASDVVFLAVSDDALRPVAAVLAEGLLEAGHVVLHTSGVHSAAILEDLARSGAHTGSFHPLQTFTGHEGKERFRGITIGIEGSEEALKVGRHLADDLLATAVVIPSDRKALYHAAAVTAGNHAIAMLATAIELWERATADAQGGRDALGPLARQSIENALALGAEVALTGPVVRGDLNTVLAHLRALHVHAEHLLPMYAAVITETVHVAMRSGRLSTEQAVAVLDVVAREVVPLSDGDA